MATMKIIDRTKQAIDEKDEAVERAFEIIGGMLERYAKTSCPVDTGLLRNSITYCLDGQKPALRDYKADRGDGSGGYDGEMPKEQGKNRAVFIGTNVEYAPSVEFNDNAKHIVGKAHFLRDSVANHINEYKNIMANELREVKIKT